MEQVRLGRSDLLGIALALGTWQLGGDWGTHGHSDSIGRYPAGRP